MKTPFLAGIACVFSVVTACSDSTSAPPDPPSTSGSSKQIDSEGGTVTDGDASVEVPADALATSTKVTVAGSDVEVEAPDGYELAGPAIAFTPHGLSFEAAVTLTLPYSSSAEELAVLRLDDEDDESWEVVSGGAFSDGSAALDVTSFSIYAVAEESAGTGEGGASATGGAGGTGETGGRGGTGGSAGSQATGGSGGSSGGGDGDLRYFCDGTDPASGLRICSEHFFPALIVELVGDDLVAACQSPAVLVDACDTTGSVGGCFHTDVDGIPGVTVTHWYFMGTPMCADSGGEFIDPP